MAIQTVCKQLMHKAWQSQCGLETTGVGVEAVGLNLHLRSYGRLRTNHFIAGFVLGPALFWGFFDTEIVSPYLQVLCSGLQPQLLKM